MTWDDIIDEKQARPLTPQFWACDCKTSTDGMFFEVVPDKEGLCTHCGHYAVRRSLIEKGRSDKMRTSEKPKVSRTRKETRGRKFNLKNYTAARELRQTGHTFQTIADTLKIGLGTAAKYCEDIK